MRTKKKKTDLVFIAAGGTGGHMFPAQAFAETMLAQGWQVKLMTDRRGARFSDAFPAQVTRHISDFGPIGQKGLKAKISVCLRVFLAVLMALVRISRDKPALVVGFGGYPSFPTLMAAWMLGVPRVIHEQNGVLGRVNMFFRKRCQALACGIWPISSEKEPHEKDAPALHIGNPVRGAVFEKAAAPYIAPGDYPMSILIIGGSQGARVLCEVVPEAIANLPEDLRDRLRVLQQVSPEDHARVDAYYAAHGIKADLRPFFHNVERQISECQLVISRAGAASIADISAIGRPAILIPYPHAIFDHQTANARAVVAAGGAISIAEPALNAVILAEQIEALLSNAEGANHMAQSMLSYARPDAAQALAALSMQVATGTLNQAADESQAAGENTAE